MGPYFGPPPRGSMDKLKEPKPENIKEVPRYLYNLITSFFQRLFYIFGLVWETGPWILFVMVFMAIFNGVMPVIGANITMNITNSLVKAAALINSTIPLEEQIQSMLDNEACQNIVRWLVIQFGFIFVRAIVGNIDSVVQRIYGELVVNHIKLKIMHKAKTVDLASFDTPEFYEKLENANREAGHRPIQILQSTFSIVSTCISMVSFIIALNAISPWASVIIAVLAVPSAIINFVYRRKNAMYVRFRSKDRRIMSYYSGMITNKDRAKEMKLYNLSDLFIERYNETFKHYYKGLRKLYITEGAWHIGLRLLNAAANCALFVYIALQVANGSQEIGNYAFYVTALNNISGGVSSLINTTASIYEGTLFIDNMIAFMKNETTLKPSLPKPLNPMRHSKHTIEFRNVSFRYPGTERDVIKNVSFVINPGDTIVLVGLNGAGKTTLIKLLTRLYDPTEGEILLDGHDIKEYEPSELYRIFGIIFQDFGRYAVSVTENIKFGDMEREYTEENIRTAAYQSNSEDFIANLPDGYETPLTRVFEDNGIELSGGQWQKLSIARAFYSDSDIIILDEPTASLDPMAEQEIFNRFDELRQDKTTVFVSHRLSSATTADKIFVLEYGELIEQGSHSELMAKHGKYYELFSTQARRYIESADVIDDEPPRHRFGDRPYPPHLGEGYPGGEGSSFGGERPFGERPPRGERPPFGEGRRGPKE